MNSKTARSGRRLIVAAVVVVLAACAGSSAAVAATAKPAHHDPACVAVTFGWLTPTGHETDEQITVCGTGLRRDQICNVSEPIQPGAVADCYTLPRKAGQ